MKTNFFFLYDRRRVKKPSFYLRPKTRRKQNTHILIIYGFHSKRRPLLWFIPPGLKSSNNIILFDVALTI